MATKKFNVKEFVRLHGLGYTDKQLEVHFNASQGGVWHKRHILGLSRNHKGNVPATAFQKSILVGTLLGDAGLHRNKRNNAVQGALQHCLKQECYFMFKYEVLKNLFGVITILPPKPIGNTQYHSNGGIRSAFVENHVDLIDMYDAFYTGNGMKTLPNKAFIFDNFTEASLAIWYFDDGFIAEKGYMLSTMCFNTEVLNFLVSLLYSKFSIKASIRSTKMLYIGVKYKQILTDILNKYKLDCINYKIHSSI